MTVITNSVGSLDINAANVSGGIGLCYFNQATETLLELNGVPETFIPVDPMGSSISKFYMVVEPDAVLSYVKISIPDSGIVAFSAKVIISDLEPNLDTFRQLPNFNNFSIENPISGTFIPVWLLIENNEYIDNITNMDIELEYE